MPAPASKYYDPISFVYAQIYHSHVRVFIQCVELASNLKAKRPLKSLTPFFVSHSLDHFVIEFLKGLVDFCY